MLNKMVLFLLLFPLGAIAQELTCIKKGEIRKMYDGIKTVEKASYCTNDDGTMLISQGCYKKNCMKELPFVDFDFDDDTILEIGNPGFALCRKMNGKPEIIEFKLKGEWVFLDRCIFKNPASTFIDTGYLYKLNSKKK